MMKKFVKKIAIKPAALAAPPTTKPKRTIKKIKADDPSSTHTSISTPYTLKADNNLIDYGITELPDFDYEPPLKKIVGMKITWLTSQEIENMATFVLTSSKTTGEGSIYDPRSGVITNYEKCAICSMGWKQCPGHPGVIKFPYPIPHPICLRQLAEFLTCVCEFCHRLVLTWKQMKTMGILRYRGENRFKAYLDMAKKTARCKTCKKPHGKYTVVDDKFFKAYKKKSEVKKIPISYDEVVEIISNIREKEFELLGFLDPLCHPKNMIIYNLMVIPISCRPFVESNNNTCHDDLSHKCIEIVKVVTKLLEKGLSEKGKLDLMDSLMFHVKTLMDNSKNKARDPNGKRPLKAIKQRISGKGGHVRQIIQGKRNSQCGRSVISPDPNLHVNEVGIPQEMADKLTYPETVYALNIAWCQKMFDTNRVNRIKRGEEWIDATRVLYTRGFKLQYGDIVIRKGEQITPTFFHTFKIQLGDEVSRTEQIELADGSIEIKRTLIKNVEPPRRKNFTLKIGDVIERKLQEGDFILLNRQPTLHEPSIRAKRIRIHPWKTIRFGLACTGAFGADFDGDF
jgi:DNA-directed RNA polymerase beta' subunit